MKKLILSIGLIASSTLANSQTWTKISGILDSSQVKGIGVINNQILVAGQNWITNSQTDYALSNDGGASWNKLPTYSYAGYLPNALPQNNLQVCSNGFTFSKKLVGNTWQSFSGSNNFAEFTNGSIIGSQGSFPDTLYNFSSAGVKGAKLGNYKFKLSSKYCAASNNRVFVFAYGVGLGYIDYSNLGTVNIPATLDGVAMTQASWDMKVITNMIKTSNGNLFAIGDGLFKSTDNGVNWNRILYFSGDAVVSIAKSSVDELYIIAQNKISKSTDLGISFTDLSGNLPPSGGGFKKEIFVNANNDVFIIVNNNGGIDASKSGIFQLTNINGINDFSNNQLAFNLYPNPTVGILNVELEVSDKTSTAIEITNTLGQIVYSKTTTENNTQLNTSNFTKGIYFVTVKSNNKTGIQKLIIN